MRRTARFALLFLAAALVGAAFAQNISPRALPGRRPSDPPPRLSEVESLRLENLQLKATVLQQQQQQLQSQFADLIRELSDEHPGYLFNPNTRQFSPAPQPQKHTEAKK